MALSPAQTTVLSFRCWSERKVVLDCLYLLLYLFSLLRAFLLHVIKRIVREVWHMAQIYLVAPAHRFVEYAHGPLTEYDETQLRAYYRSIPDMQRPTPVFGSTPLGLRLGFPRPPTSPRHGIPAPMVVTTPNRDIPPTSPTSHSDDASLLRQYRRIAFVVAFRHSTNPTRGGVYRQAHIEP